MLGRYALAALSGALYFLGFAGFDFWPLAFVALIPMLWVFDPRVELRYRDLVGLGMCFGFVTNVGGYYWIVNTLEDFSGFSFPVCVLFASIVWLYQSSALLCFSLLYRRSRRAGFDTLVSACASMVFAEWAIPLLFEHYFGASLHNVPLAIQVADLGGPLLVTALLTLANAGLYTLLRSTLESSRAESALRPSRANPPCASRPSPPLSGLSRSPTVRIASTKSTAAQPLPPRSPWAPCKPTWASSKSAKIPKRAGTATSTKAFSSSAQEEARSAGLARIRIQLVHPRRPAQRPP